MDDLKSAQAGTAPQASPPRRPASGRRWLVVAAVALLLAATGIAVTVFRHETKQGWQLEWSDEFDGSTLDRSKWSPEDHSTFGDGNEELACLMSRRANVEVAGGMLTLRAIRETSPVICGDNDTRFPHGRSYTSAMLTTEGKASWHQGRFEVRAKLPLAAGQSKGLWPAFWLRPASGSGTGELDIMEAIGTADSQDPEASSVHQTLWYLPKGANRKQTHMAEVPGGGPAKGFHTYAMEWRDGLIRWYVDAQLTYERDMATTPWMGQAFSGQFFLRLNLAVGGTFPGSPTPASGFPADMVVEWVRVYQWR